MKSQTPPQSQASPRLSFAKRNVLTLPTSPFQKRLQTKRPMTKRNKNRIASLDGTLPPPPNHPPPEFLKHNNVTNVERQPAPPPPPPPGEPPERTNIARRNSGLQPPPPPPPVGWTETQNMSYAPKQDLKMTTAPPHHHRHPHI